MKNTTLAINFYAENITEDAKAEFMQAVSHEFSEMSIQFTDTSIAQVEKRISTATGENSKTTEEEIAALRSQLAKLEEIKEAFQADSAETLETYNKVIDAMSLKNENHFGNSKDVVRTVLRVLATWNNSKLVKYAIIPAFESAALYDALEAIHINSKAGEDGNIIMSKEVKEAYKKASEELERIIKVTFSLSHETPYTRKTRVKLTAEDKKLLNDCYVKGFRNNFEVDDETGKVSFKKRQVNTLVKAKKDRKTQKITYDYSGLASVISNIVIKHYFI